MRIQSLFPYSQNQKSKPTVLAYQMLTEPNGKDDCQYCAQNEAERIEMQLVPQDDAEGDLDDVAEDVDIHRQDAPMLQ